MGSICDAIQACEYEKERKRKRESAKIGGRRRRKRNYVCMYFRVDVKTTYVGGRERLKLKEGEGGGKA